MSVNIFALLGAGVVACVLVITVRQYRPDIAVVLSAAAGVVMFACIIPDIKLIVDDIHDLAGNLNGFSAEISAVVKALGVCLAAQLAADICRDAGQTTIASRVEFGARAAVLVLLLPLFGSVLDAAAALTEAGR